MNSVVGQLHFIFKINMNDPCVTVAYVSASTMSCDAGQMSVCETAVAASLTTEKDLLIR